MGSRDTLLFIGPKEDYILQVTQCHVLHRLFFVVVVYNLSGNEREGERKKNDMRLRAHYILHYCNAKMSRRQFISAPNFGSYRTQNLLNDR